MVVITVGLSSLIGAIVKFLSVGAIGAAAVKGTIATGTAITFAAGVGLGYVVRSTPPGVRTVLMGALTGGPGIALSLATES